MASGSVRGEPTVPRGHTLRDKLSAATVRVRLALCHDGLDSALARFADPATRPLLAARAAQLAQPRHRRALARTLRSTVEEARSRPPSARCVTVVIERSQICAHAQDVLALADRLDSPESASVTGLAIAQRLVTDSLKSPFYVPTDPDLLGRVCRKAIARMDDPF